MNFKIFLSAADSSREQSRRLTCLPALNFGKISKKIVSCVLPCFKLSKLNYLSQDEVRIPFVSTAEFEEEIRGPRIKILCYMKGAGIN